MVATKNIDTLGPIWTFSLMGVLTFVANGCVLSCFEGTANVHCYTSCTLTTLHCSKVSFLQCRHMKRYNKIYAKMWGLYSPPWDTVCITVMSGAGQRAVGTERGWWVNDNELLLPDLWTLLQNKVQTWSSLIVAPPFILPELLCGTRDRWVAQVSFIVIKSTGPAPLIKIIILGLFTILR